MAVQTSNDFIDLLIKRGILPEDTISAEIVLRWGDVPIIRCERMPDGELVELIVTAIAETDEIVPPPPRPRIDKPPATENRGL